MDQNLQTAMLLWKRSLQVKRRSKQTQKQYQYHVEKMVNWLKEREVTQLSEVTWMLIEEHIAWFNQGRAQNTVRQAVNSMRSFFDYCHDRELITPEHYQKLKPSLKSMPNQYNAQRTLAINEVKRLIDSCNATPTGIRNAALMSLLFDSGLRSAEVCRVQVNQLEYDVEIAPGVIVNRILVQVKGGAKEPAYFGAETRKLVERWLNIRPQIIVEPGIEELFVGIGGNTPGEALTPPGLRALLRKLGKKAGVRGVSPHTFRRAFAVTLEAAGATTKTIKDLGRWKTLQMVLHYLRGYEAATRYNEVAPLDFIRR